MHFLGNGSFPTLHVYKPFADEGQMRHRRILKAFSVPQARATGVVAVGFGFAWAVAAATAAVCFFAIALARAAWTLLFLWRAASS